MNRQIDGSTPRPSTITLRAVLVVLALGASAGIGWAQGTAPAKPASTIEVGPGGVTDDSFKAGEYNGLQSKGANAIANIDWRGGTAGYNSESRLRWRVKGTDLGLATRSLSGDITTQGKLRVVFGYDELRRNRSDTYETPYVGAGSNVLTLPSTWLVPVVAGSSGSNNRVTVTSARGLVGDLGTAPYVDTATNSKTMGALLTPTPSQISAVNAANAADLSLFHNVDLFTKRTRFDAAFACNLGPQWGIEASFRPEHKEGVKPMGTVSRNTGGDISTIIADRIDANHDQLNLGVNYKGARGFAQAGYYLSLFRNNVPFLSWQNWAAATPTVNTMSSAPGNEFSQLSVSAGANLTRTTKIVASGSYGRSTQNDSFLTDLTTPVVPVNSLNGLVVTSAFSLRLSAKPAGKLNLTAGYKFDDHDNRTPIHIFQYADAGEAPVPNPNFPAGANNPLGAVLAQNANANRPYGRKLNQFTSDADYALGKGQWVRAGYDFERIDRTCPGSWISCADAETTSENTVRAEWRTNVGANLSARFGYTYSVRRTPNYNEDAFLALVPYANVSPATAGAGATALSFMTANGWTGWGPALGWAATTGNNNVFFPSNNALANASYANNNRISELPGMRRYDVADRNRGKVRSALSWQVSESLSFDGGLDLNRDAYPGTRYGVQNARGWAVDADATYTLADTGLTLDVFYTYEHQGSLSTGNGYTANSNASIPSNGQPGVVGLSGNSCDSFTTLQQRNNANKLDPCLDWSAEMLDRANSLGLGLRRQFGRFDITANYVLSRARWDNNVVGGNWQNNILDGPGGAPTTIAAFFIPATTVPSVNTNSDEIRLGARVTIDGRQSLRAGYSFLHMKSNDPAYEGLQIGSLSGVLPTIEQPFNYSVSVFGVSYVLTF